jgi:hypothetical protein
LPFYECINIRYKQNPGMILSSVILLGFADNTKMAGKQVGPLAEKPNKRYRDDQPNYNVIRIFT